MFKALRASNSNRRVLPVVYWLQAGTAAAAVGLSLASAPLAAADDGGTTASTRASSDSVKSPVGHQSAGRRGAGAVVAPTARAGAAAGQQQNSAARTSRTARVNSTLQDKVSAASVTRPMSAPGLPSVGASTRSVAKLTAATAAPSAPDVPTASSVAEPASLTSAGDASPLTSLANGLNTALGGVFDGIANLLSYFPAGPVNDLLSGAVLLARRALFIPVQLAGSPTVTSVNLPNAETYGTASDMNFVVNFNEQVDVRDLNVAVPVEMDYRLDGATYVSGSGTQSLLFSLKVPEYAWAPDGVTLGTVDSSGIRTFGFGDLIVDKASAVEVNSAIPTLDTHRVQVDAQGPQITGRSDLAVSSGGVSLTVTFDRPVVVTGTPTVPVNIDGVDRLLTYTSGNRSSTLTFSLAQSGVNSATFRPYTGDVIYLPEGTAGISDRLGNSIYTLEGDINTPLIENGNQLVVIGQHFERLAITGSDGTTRTSLSAADLDGILNGSERSNWYTQSTLGPPLYQGGQSWPFLADYPYPTYAPSTNSVDVYRVGFRSSIPTQQRITTAYGLVAVPTDAAGSIPVVEWQQATVFNLTNSAPSQAFSCGTNPGSDCPQQSENVPPRLEVAQFAGKGYAVFIPDLFGLGNSAKYLNYSYMVKDAITQNSTDMYNASLQLLAARGLEQSNLFLAGWSAGGNQSADWLEKIESQGGAVDGVSIASSPLALGPVVRNGVFNPRTWTAQNTGDAAWLNVTVGFTAFSQGGYQGLPSTALDTLGQYYDTARRLYTGQYTNFELGLAIPYVGPYWGPVTQNDPLTGVGVTVYYTDVNGQEQSSWMPYSPAQLIVPKYTASELAYDASPYARFMNASGSGLAPWASPVYLQYGTQDEVMTATSGESVYSWQQQAYNKQNIGFVVTDPANHVGNYLLALQNDLAWFNSIVAQN